MWVGFFKWARPKKPAGFFWVRTRVSEPTSAIRHSDNDAGRIIHRFSNRKIKRKISFISAVNT